MTRASPQRGVAPVHRELSCRRNKTGESSRHAQRRKTLEVSKTPCCGVRRRNRRAINYRIGLRRGRLWRDRLEQSKILCTAHIFNSHHPSSLTLSGRESRPPETWATCTGLSRSGFSFASRVHSEVCSTRSATVRSARATAATGFSVIRTVTLSQAATGSHSPLELSSCGDGSHAKVYSPSPRGMGLCRLRP